jgi:hypothetical protein
MAYHGPRGLLASLTYLYYFLDATQRKHIIPTDLTMRIKNKILKIIDIGVIPVHRRQGPIDILH